MLTVLRLTQREIEDHAWFFVGVLILSMVSVAWTIVLCPGADTGPRVGSDTSYFVVRLYLYFLPALCIGAGALGALQVASDRTAGVSGFLFTQAVTRGHILLAKWLAGAVWICLGLVPMAVTHVVYVYPRVFPWYQDLRPLQGAILASSLVVVAAYAGGVQVAVSFGKVIAGAAVIVLVLVLLSMLVIKGIGPVAMILLGLYTAGALARTWCTFMDLSL